MATNDTTFTDKSTTVATAWLQDVNSVVFKSLVFPEVWGAVGDGATDDATALQDCFPNSVAGSTIVMASPYGYASASALTFPSGKNLLMYSPLIDISGAASYINLLTIGEAGTENKNRNLLIRVDKSPISDLGDIGAETSVGVQIIEIFQSMVDIRMAKRFTIGAQLHGNTGGVAYNDVHLGIMRDNYIGLDLTSTGAGGFVKDNSFFGGNFQATGSEGSSHTGFNRYGVRVTSTDGLVYQGDNVFYKPSFQLSNSQASPGEAIPFLLEYSSGIHAYHMRHEGNTGPIARLTNNSRAAYFHVGTAASLANTISIDDQNSDDRTSDVVVINDSVAGAGSGLYNAFAKPMFHTGPIWKTWCYADGSSLVHVPKTFQIDSSTGTKAYAKACTVAASYLEFSASQGIGITVDTSAITKFVLRRDFVSSYPGRVICKAYDSGGTLLTSSDPNDPYVKMRDAAWTASWGGAYALGTDTSCPDDVAIEVHSDVKSLDIILTGGTAVLRLRAFQVDACVTNPTFGHTTEVWTGYEEIVSGVNLGTTPPTSGTWAVGRTVMNVAPAIGAPVGWRCTAAGTPGTWESLAILESIQNTITAYAGGGQANATALTGTKCRATTVATSGDSVKLPAATGSGAEILVINSGAAPMDVFPQTGESIDALAANTALSVVNGKRTIFVDIASTLWMALPGA